jgi:hypothetical protein
MIDACFMTAILVEIGTAKEEDYFIVEAGSRRLA